MKHHTRDSAHLYVDPIAEPERYERYQRIGDALDRAGEPGHPILHIGYEGLEEFLTGGPGNQEID